jgi:hypothetical protein
MFRDTFCVIWLFLSNGLFELETGWTTLSSRRHNRKFQLFYNIKNGHAPNCLRELIPPKFFFFLSEFFFSEFNIRLCDKNSESDYYFFPPPKSEYFFQQHWESEYYSETGWTTLSSRRHNRKFQLFYNIKNGHAPNCLRELIPPIVQSTTIYPLRNGSDLIIHFCRLSITTEYFIPSTVCEVGE